jgi:ParB-like chromosome segregation protein Spo0J
VNGKPARRPATKAQPRIEWPADAVERRPLAELFPYARNARTHSDAQVAQIAASIREWGWTIPVLVDEAGELIAGHGRVLAARQLNIETVPVMTARGWSEAKIRAYRIADNKLGLNSGWDDELLALELADLRDLGAALDLTGFDAASLESLLAA